ncbi:hypothetical protein ACIBVK_29140 [Micromonospora echinofusca]|uniref:hypothetical protein n=1 Tax=Micromonospora echinofusca TaxID=47858 RepID=UPI0037B029E3
MTARSPLTERLYDALATHATSTGRSRISLVTLMSIQAQIEQHAATRSGARARLRAALDTLAAAGRLEAPQGKKLWDQTAQPALPAWITVITDLAPATISVDLDTVFWAPAISRWLREWTRISRPGPGIRASLQEINTWLLEHLAGPPPIVAREERSLDIFGDEKKLARIEASSIFAAHRLSPQELAYERPIPPLRAARLADHGDLLLIENQSTFDSAWRALRHDPSPFAAVAFSNGWEAAFAEPTLHVTEHLQLREPPARIWYAGDLDLDGLDIPLTLTANLQTHDHPLPYPLTSAYEAMLAAGTTTTSNPIERGVAEQAAEWLPQQLRQETADLLTTGNRIAQEVLDRTWWSNPTWRREVLSGAR